MNRILKLCFLMVLFFLLSDCSSDGAVASCSELPKPNSAEELALYQKPLKEVAGSRWTKDLDCRYLNPPENITVFNKAVSCEANEHNIKVYKSGCPYFRSQSTFHNGPIWCLVPDAPKDLSAVISKRDIYCK